MSTSTLTLFTDFPFRYEENKCIEDIADYLEDLDSLEIKDFQFIKNTSSTFSVKIEAPQSAIEFKLENNVNYCSIENDSGRIRYFYIIARRWLATKTIVFDLQLDELNTFMYGTDYILSDKTQVTREHKDRWSGKTRTSTLHTINDTCDSEAYVNGLLYGYKDITYTEANAITEYEWNSYNIPKPVILSQITNMIKIRVFGDNAGVGIGDTCHASITVYMGGYQAIIDPYSEGLNSELIKDSETELVDTFVNNHWNLVIQASNDSKELNDPVYEYLIPDQPVKISLPTATPTYTYSNFDDGGIYLITGHAPATHYSSDSLYGIAWTEVEFSADGTDYKTLTDTASSNIYDCRWYYIKRTGTTLTLYEYTQNYYKPLLIEWKNSKNVTTRTITAVTLPNNATGLWTIKVTAMTDDFHTINPNVYNPNPTILPIATWTTYDLAGIDSFDKEDPKILKIINLPYAPFNAEFQDNKMLLPEGFSYDSGKLKLNKVMNGISGTIESNVVTPLSKLYRQNFTPALTNLKNKQYETKLLHSDFYLPKFVYESSSYPFKLEDIDESKIDLNGGIPNLSFKFAIATSGSSKSYFIFDNINWKRSREDYDNHLSTNRNNELPLFTNQYLNYLRTGYNYDVKARDRAIGSNNFNVGMGLLKAGLDIGGADKMGEVVGSGLSMISTTYSGIKNYQSINDNFNYKIDQLRMQSISVSGSDDLALFNQISNNHAKLVNYKVNDRLENLLFNLFYHYGYMTQEMKTPAIDTRAWFNYLQCEADISGINAGLSNEIIQDLKAKFAEGVTFFHNNNDAWDLDQEMENWEVSLL